jgi:hypothetical protein
VGKILDFKFEENKPIASKEVIGFYNPPQPSLVREGGMQF